MVLARVSGSAPLRPRKGSPRQDTTTALRWIFSCSFFGLVVGPIVPWIDLAASLRGPSHHEKHGMQCVRITDNRIQLKVQSRHPAGSSTGITAGVRDISTNRPALEARLRRGLGAPLSRETITWINSRSSAAQHLRGVARLRRVRDRIDRDARSHWMWSCLTVACTCRRAPQSPVQARLRRVAQQPGCVIVPCAILWATCCACRRGAEPSGDHGTAAVTTISIFQSGWASLACTVARAGVAPCGTH